MSVRKLTANGLRTAAGPISRCRRVLKASDVHRKVKIIYAPPPLISRCEARLNAKQAALTKCCLAALCAVTTSRDSHLPVLLSYVQVNNEGTHLQQCQDFCVMNLNMRILSSLILLFLISP